MSEEKRDYLKEISQRIVWTGPSKQMMQLVDSPNPDWSILVDGNELTEEEKETLLSAIKTGMESAERKLREEREDRLKKLAKHYNITYQTMGDNWLWELCLRICTDNITGFKLNYNRFTGRPVKWDQIEDTLLILNIAK